MSKDKPEVGDVWYIKGARIYIADIHNGFVDSIRQLYHNCYRDRGYTIRELLQEGKYLGKSKVSIKELFDVAED